MKALGIDTEKTQLVNQPGPKVPARRKLRNRVLHSANRKRSLSRKKLNSGQVRYGSAAN